VTVNLLRNLKRNSVNTNIKLKHFSVTSLHNSDSSGSVCNFFRS